MPNLNTTLLNSPKIAQAIQWQFRSANPANAYAPPTAADKIPWNAWTRAQKLELEAAYQSAVALLRGGPFRIGVNTGGLTDRPNNIHPNVANDAVTVMEQVTPAYMWKLYLGHIAFALAAETSGLFRWSINTYTASALRYLFDSTTMAWYINSNAYSMGTYAVYVPAKRADNLPMTAFAAPSWTYAWLKQKNLIGPSRRATIYSVLEWMRQNMSHFYGSADFGTCNAVWQYRGYPPLSRIVNGTIDANNPGIGKQHWTAGCHGSVGFLNAVLRVVNIPVQPVWVCGHELAYFIADRLYLDHGDDPYNLNVKNSPSPINSLLIDEATYKLWFTTDLTVNITDNTSPACANVGRQAAQFV
jgi:hypothetical protein